MRTDVLLAGAGPYGFAVAAEAARRGFEVAVVGWPFATWHEHTLDGMYLRSDPRASSIWSADDRWDLPAFLARGREPVARPLPVAAYRRYLTEVAGRAPFDLRDGEVVALDRNGDGFSAAWSGGDAIAARAVVLATGLGSHLHVPGQLAALPPERVLHSWHTRDIQRLDNRDVLVVGGGQSAAETVECLLGRNRVTWLMRSEPLFFSEPLRAPTPLFKAMLAASHTLLQLPPPLLRLVSNAVFRPTITPRLRAVYDDPAVRIIVADVADLGLSEASDGLVSRAGDRWDVVVAATGFRHRRAGFGFLAPTLAAALGPADEPPGVDARFQSPVPGLYLVGGVAEAAHGPVVRFIVGSRCAARRVTRDLERHLAV